MRVVELDKFVTRINGEIDECRECENDTNAEPHMRDVARGSRLGLTMAKAIASTLAWNEEERPKGEWKDIVRRYTKSNGCECGQLCRMCSNCNWSYAVTTVGQRFSEYKYCPNCGAKMKKESTDE
jgi:uncharacterized Fe-S cluster-containing MiaB family protein